MVKMSAFCHNTLENQLWVFRDEREKQFKESDIETGLDQGLRLPHGASKPESLHMLRTVKSSH